MRATVVLMFFVLLKNHAQAGVTIQEKRTYYDVTGGTEQQLRASINQQRLALGKRFDALTTWAIRWRFKHTSTQPGCKITEVVVDATIEYLLPRWPDANTHADRRLVEKWQHYIDRLTEHELQHGAYAKTAAADIEQAIFGADNSTVAPKDCAALVHLANREARRVMTELNRLQRAFDVKTMHGRRTGATFP